MGDMGGKKRKNKKKLGAAVEPIPLEHGGVIVESVIGDLQFGMPPDSTFPYPSPPLP